MSVTDTDVVEAKYRIEKAFRMLERNAEGNAKAALAQAYDALDGDTDELEGLVDDE